MEKITLQELLKLDITGKVVCFPTDTVYGVGAKVDDLEAINKIYQMKHRDTSKPLAILCGKVEQIFNYTQNISPKAYELMEKYWPGALTIIFEKSNSLSDEITKGLPTVAFRMPNSEIALSILNHFGLMATTSVNISGDKEMNDVDLIYQTFDGYIDYIVTDYQELVSLPSTIVDSRNLKVLRQGSVKINA